MEIRSSRRTRWARSAASTNTNDGAGAWTFDTATGTNQELVSAPASGGLHALVQHEVNFQHDNGATRMPFEATIGSANVTPDHVEQDTATDTGSFDVTFSLGIDLDGLDRRRVRSQPAGGHHEIAHQDDPDDPSTASVKKDVTLSTPAA